MQNTLAFRISKGFRKKWFFSVKKSGIQVKTTAGPGIEKPTTPGKLCEKERTICAVELQY
ncbi:MAG TPA: hypothetical protein DCL86_02285 [Bacteroidales bacterium]|jgi:hypothetical protein|nr:hypothetical protein [Bacteroidales bacterium]